MRQFGIVLAMCLATAGLAAIGCSEEKSNSEPAVVYTSRTTIAVTQPSNRYHTSSTVSTVTDDLEIRKKSYVNLATTPAVLILAVNEDLDADGVRLDRIRKTSYFVDNPETTVKLLQKKLSVESVKDTDLIRISLTGPNRTELPQVVNAAADALVHYASKRVESQITKRMKTLNGRLGEIRNQIDAKCRSIDSIRRESEVPLMAERRNILQMTLQSMTDELATLKRLKTQADTALKSLQDQKAAGTLKTSPEVLRALEQDPTHRSLVKAAQNLKTELQALENRFGGPRRLKPIQDRLETVELVRAQIEKKLVEKTIKAMIQQQESKIAAVSDRIEAVEKSHAHTAKDLRTISAKLIKIESIQAKIERLQNTARELEIALTSSRSHFDAPPLEIRSYAKSPDEPTR